MSIFDTFIIDTTKAKIIVEANEPYLIKEASTKKDKRLGQQVYDIFHTDDTNSLQSNA